MKTTAEKIAVCHVRWMIRRDMPEVLAIENASFEFPWSEDDFLHSLRQRNCIGMVTEARDRVTGYMVYELHSKRLVLLSMAVHPTYRGMGHGKAMIDKLTGKLSWTRRTRIETKVRETNLNALQFLRLMGFRATGILRGEYDDTQEDAIVMKKSIETH